MKQIGASWVRCDSTTRSLSEVQQLLAEKSEEQARVRYDLDRLNEEVEKLLALKIKIQDDLSQM